MKHLFLAVVLLFPNAVFANYYIGVRVSDTSKKCSVQVNEVTSDRARNAGIVSGDVVKKVDTLKVCTNEALIAAVQKAGIDGNQKVTVTLTSKNGSTKTIDVPIKSRERPSAAYRAYSIKEEPFYALPLLVGIHPRQVDCALSHAPTWFSGSLRDLAEEAVFIAFSLGGNEDRLQSAMMKLPLSYPGTMAWILTQDKEKMEREFRAFGDIMESKDPCNFSNISDPAKIYETSGPFQSVIGITYSTNSEAVIADLYPDMVLNSIGKQAGFGPGQDSTSVGVYVSGIKDGMAAQNVGLEAGDIITSINGIPVNAENLKEVVRKFPPGQTVFAVVLKKGALKVQQVGLLLSERPEPED
ncbi:PDZ domain-containing protein [Mameliella alba]|uniref:PDZ domain-containing protein n=1 Tax=Mameliella alba TaxID=561184 RepID=UPI00088315FD|nr:PDZ domain-containing protein [Mameliella alba]OWV48225.1 hypothetical protein CDZ96_10435 [Mameliella alba]PTR40266.1 PDZ domain-containing protein [Mameliella alba]GGF43598.1 hypothetical protein GCM10011319_01740 [Mameliella alba]SDC97578.1 PDZ domain-containing protein [Mameliella alba]